MRGVPPGPTSLDLGRKRDYRLAARYFGYEFNSHGLKRPCLLFGLNVCTGRKVGVG